MRDNESITGGGKSPSSATGTVVLCAVTGLAFGYFVLGELLGGLDELIGHFVGMAIGGLIGGVIGVKMTPPKQ